MFLLLQSLKLLFLLFSSKRWEFLLLMMLWRFKNRIILLLIIKTSRMNCLILYFLLTQIVVRKDSWLVITWGFAHEHNFWPCFQPSSTLPNHNQLCWWFKTHSWFGGRCNRQGGQFCVILGFHEFEIQRCHIYV